MDQTQKIIELEEKNHRLESKCDNIYDQITELRTTIQEIYSDVSRSERFLCHEMLQISKRLEELARQVRPQNTTITVSPHINQNPKIISSSSSGTEAQSTDKTKKKGFLGIDLDNMMKLGITATVGLLVLIGFISIFFIKLFSLFSGLFN